MVKRAVQSACSTRRRSDGCSMGMNTLVVPSSGAVISRNVFHASPIFGQPQPEGYPRAQCGQMSALAPSASQSSGGSALDRQPP